jgi:hydroxymethylpyrimidine pyrophosphatase-like HAD family hydrolase
MIYLFDIDGTIADCQHRIHFIAKKDWRGFFGAVNLDSPIWPVIQTLKLLKSAGATIILMSGRSDECRSATEDWLEKWGVKYHALYMRKAGDHRPDNIVKEYMLEKVGKEWDLAQIMAIFDDRDQVVKMYRAKGYKVFQCAEGNF